MSGKRLQWSSYISIAGFSVNHKNVTGYSISAYIQQPVIKPGWARSVLCGQCSHFFYLVKPFSYRGKHINKQTSWLWLDGRRRNVSLDPFTFYQEELVMTFNWFACGLTSSCSLMCFVWHRSLCLKMCFQSSSGCIVMLLLTGGSEDSLCISVPEHMQ